jgi:glycosyltransferase involved in cell wall biosynthesis
MIQNKTNLPAKKIKIIFLAWGFSIHAQRRIQIFADDPLFEVMVVSTYNYQFSHATTIPLSIAREGPKIQNSSEKKRFSALCSKLEKVIYPFILISKFINEIINSIRDYIILKKTVDAFNPDIIFLQTLLYPNYLVYLLRRKAPIIITFWNGDVTWWAKWTGIERILKKYIVIHGVKIATAITVNSKTAFKACTAYGKPAKDIHLIPYPGINCNRFKPLDKKMAREYIGCNASRIVFWPRGIGEYLNFDTLVSASQNVLKKYPDLIFIVVHANKKMDPSIMDCLKKYKIEKNFTFLERIQFEDMPYYYSAADMMISISSNDSLPNSMLEAMACGCPVIMGDIPQIRDWIIDGVNGYLCPVQNSDELAVCVQKILDNHGNLNEKFIEKNLNLIADKVDSTKMSAIIKNLLITIVSSERKLKGR